VHTAAPGLLFTVSPFYHFNRANYIGGSNDPTLSTLDKLDSQYAGAQITLSAVSKRNNARVGVYGYGEHDSRLFGLTRNGRQRSGTSTKGKLIRRPSGAISRGPI
jgi:hypothetical protein